MKEVLAKVYVGIDVHKTEHWAAVVPLTVMKKPGNAWKKLKPVVFKNSAQDFERLDSCIAAYTSNPKQVKVAVDHTGGHYSEPVVYFLQRRGYDVCYLETKAVKASRDRLLDQESKSDVIDSTGAAFLLYLQDVHGMSFRVSAVAPELESMAWILNCLMLQRLQFTKAITQITNRLHQFLIAVFPEGEANYFKQLLSVTAQYPTPKDILESDGLKAISGLRRSAGFPPRHWRRHHR